ncbi:MAG: FliO/MopB family protein [Phycisphaerae bacterium]
MRRPESRFDCNILTLRRVAAYATTVAALLTASAPLRADSVAAADADRGASRAASRNAADAGDAVSSWISGMSSQPEAAERTLHRGRTGKIKRSRNEVTPPKGSARRSVQFWWPTFAILGFIIVAALVARRFFPQIRHRTGGGAIKVLARHPLSNKQSLCLIRLGRGLVLVGVTSDRIQTLARIEDPEEAASVIGMIERGRSDSFTSALNRLAERQDGGPAAQENRAAWSARPSRDRLAQTRESVQTLVARVRGMAGSLGASAEPT